MAIMKAVFFALITLIRLLALATALPAADTTQREVVKRGHLTCGSNTECYDRWNSNCQHYGYLAGLAQYRCSQEGCSCVG